MEIFGGVIAGVQLADRVIMVCGKYAAGVKGAKGEIETLQKELEGTKTVFQNVNEFMAKPDDTTSEKFPELMKIAVDCENELKELEKKLEVLGKRRFKVLSSRSLSWPFERGEVDQIVGRLERKKTSLALALNLLIIKRQYVAKANAAPFLVLIELQGRNRRSCEAEAERGRRRRRTEARH